MEAADAAPGRGDQEIGAAIAVDVAERDGIEAEGAPGNPAGVRLQQAAVLARVEIGAAGADRLAAVLPGADNEIREAVAVHVARQRPACAEFLSRPLAAEPPQ